MKSTIIECLYRILRDADVPPDARLAVTRTILSHVLRLSRYRSQRRAVKELVGQEIECRVYECMQGIKQLYDAQVLLWRAIYCYLETGDINKAAHSTRLSTDEIAWVLSVFEDTDDLSRVPQCAPAHWSVTPISEREVVEIVSHRRVQSTIRKLLQYGKSGVIWSFDDGTTQQDLKSDLSLKVIATVMNYEASRRSRWHLINGVLIAIENEVNNKVRKATSSGSGSIIDESMLASRKIDKITEEHNEETESQEAPEASECNPVAYRHAIQRNVPMVGMTQDGDEFDLGEAVADDNFAGMQKVIDIINTLKAQLDPHVYEYLRVVVLREQHEDFERWVETTDPQHAKALTETALMRHAKRFFGLTQTDMKKMQGAMLV